MAEFKLKQTAEEVQRAIDDASIPSDWNQTDSSAADFIKNKPFYDSPTGGDTLYWDGNTEGLVSGSGIADGEKINAYYKISDTVPTKNDFANGFTFAVKNPLDGTDVNIEISASDAQSSFSDDGFAILADGLFAIIPLGGYIFSFNELEITCPEPGVYHITPMMVSAVANTLTIHGYTGFPVTKKIEEKYLPGAVILYADTSVTTSSYLYTTSDTSDVSKRITKNELMAVCVSGKKILVQAEVEGLAAYLTPELYGEPGDFAMIYATGIGEMHVFYTAEYTAS